MNPHDLELKRYNDFIAKIDELSINIERLLPVKPPEDQLKCITTSLSILAEARDMFTKYSEMMQR